MGLMEIMKRYHQIAIDGPAGAGKSTVARKVAESLGYCYLDTGAMYRAVAYKALVEGISLDDEQAVTNLAQNTNVCFNRGDGRSVFCDGRNITTHIRSTEVSRAVSVVAAYPGVRERLVHLQRQEAAKGSVVMDGRDIGTYVLPEAEVKIYLTASEEERARRRYLENLQAGKVSSLEEVLEDIQQRDRLDSEREYAPLKPAADAYILDTTGLPAEQVAEKIVSIVRRD
ncbi:MAG: Cytidylate kinase [Candidatus Dichloromethanomonas elyunquensis]|nr:MAG: Cytidylate kinase [Candidatus Dichloromethanomonas elyunquensis]